MGHGGELPRARGGVLGLRLCRPVNSDDEHAEGGAGNGGSRHRSSWGTRHTTSYSSDDNSQSQPIHKVRNGSDLNSASIFYWIFYIFYLQDHLLKGKSTSRNLQICSQQWSQLHHVCQVIPEGIFSNLGPIYPKSVKPKIILAN